MKENGGAERPGHVAVSSGGTPARENCLELGNAALPVLDSGQGDDAEVGDVEAEL